MMPGAATGFLRCAVLPNVAGLSPRIPAMNAAPSLEPTPALPSVQRLLHQVHPQRLVGAVVLVREHGVLRHASATGLADRESATPMLRDQLFRLASVSKPLLATVILRLVAEGVLDLDAPVQRWLPDFRPALADGSTPQSEGTWRWGGAYGHSWFVDPARGLSVVALTNTLYEGMDGAFVDELRDAVYADLEAAR